VSYFVSVYIGIGLMGVLVLSRLVAGLGLSVVAAALSVAAPSPALAVGSGDPVISSPTNGSTVPSGYTGPFTVDFTNAPADSYLVEVGCMDSGYYWSSQFNYDGSQNVKSWTLPAMHGPLSDCYADVSSADRYVENDFKVASPPPPALAITRVSQSPSRFFPLVHDRYRDATKTRFHTNVRSTVKVYVTGNHGKVVRSDERTYRLGTHVWTWNGAKNSGAKAATGTYKIRMGATKSSAKVVSTVTVATGWRTKHADPTRYGYEFSSAHAAPSCHIHRDFGTVAEELDCWGGKEAFLHYRFTLPKNAQNVKWHVDGHKAYDDFPGQGKISRSGKKLDKTHYHIEVKVTGWRAYDVKYAWVTYTYKARI